MSFKKFYASPIKKNIGKCFCCGYYFLENKKKYFTFFSFFNDVLVYYNNENVQLYSFFSVKQRNFLNDTCTFV